MVLQCEECLSVEQSTCFGVDGGVWQLSPLIVMIWKSRIRRMNFRSFDGSRIEDIFEEYPKMFAAKYEDMGQCPFPVSPVFLPFMTVLAMLGIKYSRISM